MTIPGFDRLKDATKKAFDRVAKVGQVETDPDLALYSSLLPQDFTELMKDYGEQNIIEYIKSMEAKRMGVKAKPKGGNYA